MTLRFIGFHAFFLLLLMQITYGCSSSSTSFCETDDQSTSSQQCNAKGLCEEYESDFTDESYSNGELIVSSDSPDSNLETSIDEMKTGEMSADEMSAGEMNAGQQSPKLAPCETTLCLEEVRITNDRNGDGLMSSDESAILNYFSMRNNGTESIERLTGVDSSNSPYLTFRTERLRFTPGSSHRYVNADENRDNSDRLCPADDDCGQATNIRFSINENALAGQVLNIIFTLSDGLNNSYQLSYPIEVQ